MSTNQVANRNKSTRLPGAPSVTPVFVLTGFLGSGKTTLLARLVQQPDLADTAVIVNEFGEVGLDHLLLARGEEADVVLLESGCLCCTVNDSLGETLSDLFYRRERKTIPAFRRVVIETSGLADPAPILQTLMSDRFLASRYTLGAVIACADGLLFPVERAAYPEAARQVAMADRIVITKVDLADMGVVSATRQDINALNPVADVLEGAHGTIDSQRLLALAPNKSATARRGDNDHDHGEHTSVDHTSGIVSISVAVPHAVTWPAYAEWIASLQRNFGDRLLRVKGLVRFVDELEPRVIQGVQHLFAPPAEAGRPIVAATGVTFIAHNVTAAELAKSVALLGD